MSPLLETFGFASARGWRVPSNGGASYELISTTNIATTGIITFDFLSIPAIYKHLQLRFTYQVNTSTTSEYGLTIAPNGESASTDNAFHYLSANGTTVSSSAASSSTITARAMVGYPQPTTVGGNINPSLYQTSFVAGVIDFADYASTTKNKTIRSFAGFTSGGGSTIQLNSAVWTDLTAINKLSIYASNAPQFTVGSRFSLYGIRG